MRGFVDTNIFVYASYSSFPAFEKARRFLKECLEGDDLWYTSWGVIYEYLRVVTHPTLFPKKPLTLGEALGNVSRFVKAPRVEVLLETETHLQLMEQLEKELPSLKGSILHDAHMVVLMREHELGTIYSADTDLHRFKGISVVNPC